MLLTDELKNHGFLLQNVNHNDLEYYINVKRTCYKTYVDEHYGGWVENTQIDMNTAIFTKTIKDSCFKKIILNDVIVGFLSYNEGIDRIDEISIQMIGIAQHQGIGSLYLQYITALSIEKKKPIFLKVFKTNPAQNLYKRFGFETYAETVTHYLMRFN